MFDLEIWYRMVGGFIGTGSTQLGRLRWALPMALYMVLCSGIHHEGWAQAAIVLAAVTVTAFLGRLISHSRFQATASLGNSLGMGVVNILRLALILVPYSVGNWLSLSDFHPWRLALCGFGALSGVAYYFSLKYLEGIDSGVYFRNTHAQWRIGTAASQLPVVAGGVVPDPAGILDQCAVKGSEWGELLTGALAYELMVVVAMVLP